MRLSVTILETVEQPPQIFLRGVLTKKLIYTATYSFNGITDAHT
jgi:hypothetical protein